MRAVGDLGVAGETEVTGMLPQQTGVFGGMGVMAHGAAAEAGRSVTMLPPAPVVQSVLVALGAQLGRRMRA